MKEVEIKFRVAEIATLEEQLRAAAHVASGRITPAEGRRLVAEGRKTIKAAEAALKLGTVARKGLPS